MALNINAMLKAVDAGTTVLDVADRANFVRSDEAVQKAARQAMEDTRRAARSGAQLAAEARSAWHRSPRRQDAVAT